MEQTPKKLEEAFSPQGTGSEKSQSARFREIAMLTRSLIEAEDALEQEKASHQETREALERAEYEVSQGYAAILSSTAWRVTAPLRWAVTKLRR